ncbi:hypothetical protein SteCoe_13378 [Stentor coeruleus]|uniref:GB1/RHD3-type G domain-containing protein n=1 Tax=Stentor coeruleus TaxID=5963 RepID=A0A1R2C8K3_9CILI|nr:hypothetical protein SteCoe_13378 [Stentor coeruleus]
MANLKYSSPSTEFEFTDTALPLLTYNQNTKNYEIATVALAMLRSLKGKISVITVAGLYRTGKSYLLNQVLLERKNGFRVGPSINPCTKGMWLWGRPLEGLSYKNEPCNILLIDTEGIGGLDENPTHDSCIFALSLLFSSFFIYNSVGSIDESAIQSISLVLNLANHIINPTSKDLSQYFPSFLWVVRDFSLQLIDEKGHPLTSKEYLEKVLMPQKGSSEACEEKNNIRKLIKTYFKDRNCCTLVRPTNNEGELQCLDEKDIQTLRPEFISQTRELRKNIMTGIKLKEINGKALDGEIIAEMMISYVDTINNGSVPCIDNTWNYLCKNIIGKVMKECEDMYEYDMNRCLDDDFPVAKEILKQYHSQAKLKALNNFKAKAVGEDLNFSISKIKDKIKEKYSIISSNNQDACKQICTNFLSDNYSIISTKLKKNQIKSYQDFEKELKTLKDYAKNHCPVMDIELLYEFLLNSTSITADFFFKSLSNEINIQKDLTKNTIFRLENDYKETTDILCKERDQLRLKLSISENSRIDLSLKEKSASEKLEELKSDRDSYEKEYRNTIRSIKNEFNEKLEESTKKLWEYEEKIKELEREIFRAQSDTSQELALLQQKTRYLEKSLEEYETREQKAQNDLKLYKLDHKNIIKELSSKQEEQIANYQSRLSQETDKYKELEKVLYEKNTELDQLKSKNEETEARLENLLSNFKESEEFNKTLLEQRERFFKQEWEKSIEKYESDLQHMRKTLNQAESKLKNHESNKLQISATLSKESAILAQKIDFLEQELKDTKKSLDLEKKRQANLLSSMNNINLDSSKNDLITEIIKIQETYDANLKSYENNFNITKNEQDQEITYLKTTIEDLELQNKIMKNMKTIKEKELNEENDILKEEKIKLLEKIKSLTFEYSKFVEDTEKKAQNKAKELEDRAEEMISCYIRENIEIKAKHEEVISQLKKYCDEDKRRNEIRVKEEKDRADKKIKIISEEYEKKILEEQENYESEIKNLQEELREIHEKNSKEIQHLRRKEEFDSQKISTLEKYLNSAKQQISSIQNTQAQALETHLQAFNCERSALLDKIERLALELANKERENSNFAFRIEQLLNKNTIKDKEIEDVKEQYSKEHGLLIEKLESSKQSYHKLADEMSQKKSEFKKDMALANQHIEFQYKKIADLEKSLQENMSKGSDSIKTWGNESSSELVETIEKLNNDKEAAEKKNEESKKKIKEMEMKFSRQTAMLEKEKSILTEKVIMIENKKLELEKRIQEEVKGLKSQMICSKDFDSLGRTIYLAENEKLKEKNCELEKTTTEISACYDRERVLWENKFTFLIQQRDQARDELKETQEKFDLALERLQKRKKNDKIGTATSTLISSVETRYLSQIKEIHEKYSSNILELKQKNKNLEREIKNLKEDYEIEKRNRSNDTGLHSKKMQDLINNEKKLMNDIEEIKTQKDKKIKDAMEMFKTEKKSFKGKIHEYQKKIKELDNSKGQMLLEFEKEKAKWALERDRLISEKDEDKDFIEGLEKKKDALIKENEKLRSYRGRMPSSRIDSLGSVNKSYMIGLCASNSSFDEASKEMKASTCASPGNLSNDFSNLTLRNKNFDVLKAHPNYQGELTKKLRRVYNENSYS